MRHTILCDCLARDISDMLAVDGIDGESIDNDFLNAASNGRNSRLLRSPVIRRRRRDAYRVASFLQIRASNSLLGNRPFDQRHVTSKFPLDRTIDTFVRCPERQRRNHLQAIQDILHTVIKNFMNDMSICNSLLGIFNTMARSCRAK